MMTANQQRILERKVSISNEINQQEKKQRILSQIRPFDTVKMARIKQEEAASRLLDRIIPRPLSR